MYQTIWFLRPISICLLLVIHAQAQDYPQWGGSPARNNVSLDKNIPTKWNVETKENILWSTKLGSQNYGNPVVASGKVLVGTNNAAGFRPVKHPADEDRGCL